MWCHIIIHRVGAKDMDMTVLKERYCSRVGRAKGDECWWQKGDEVKCNGGTA